MITHIVHAPSGLPVENLHLCGAHVVALIILAHLAAVGPQAGEGQGIRAGEGQYAVDIQRTLNIHAAGGRGEVFQRDVIHTAGRHGDLPRHGGAVGSIHAVHAGFATHFGVAVEGKDVRIHGLRTGGRVLVGEEISVIGIAAPQTGHVGGQVSAFVLMRKILRFAAQQREKPRHCSDKEQDPNELAILFQHNLAPLIITSGGGLRYTSMNRRRFRARPRGVETDLSYG